MLFGEIGLLLSIVESGLLVNLGSLRLVGLRAFGVAIVGTLLLPLPIAFGVARLFKCGYKEALAVSVCFLPSSSNIAVLYLRRYRLLNTPIGQLLVAATSIDDVIALVGIGQLRALSNASAQAFLEPLVGYGIAVIVGFVSVLLVPRIVMRVIIPYCPARLVPKAMLFFTGGMAALMMKILDALRGSYLLGAFFTGLSLCTLTSMHHIWHSQLKRLQTWLLRLFFGATVAFDVPIVKFGKPRVLAFAAALLLAVLGKALCGVLAQPRDARNVLTVAFAYCTIGELAFVAAVISYHELNIMSKDTFAAVCLAVIVSNILGPFLLRRTLAFFTRSVERDLSQAVEGHHESSDDHAASDVVGSSLSAEANSDGGVVKAADDGAVYYKMNLRCRGRWGLLGDVLRVLNSARCVVLEFRTETVGGGDILYETYVRDEHQRAAEPAADHVQQRMSELRIALMKLLSHDPGAADSTIDGSPTTDVEENVDTSIDFTNFRGLFIRRWQPQSPAADSDNAARDARLESRTTRQISQRATVLDILSRVEGSLPSTSSAEISPASTRGLALTRSGTFALARANAVDLALATASAAAELEIAQEEALNEGLLGVARSHRPATLAPDLATATSAAESVLEAVAAAALAANAEVHTLEEALSNRAAVDSDIGQALGRRASMNISNSNMQ